MDQLQAMRVFTRVVELGSFTLAARRMGMSPAAVTRSISMLESHLNSRLLNRTTRSVALTEHGQEYLEGCREIIQKLEEMESMLTQTTSNPFGTLRIAAPTPFATTELAKPLSAYRTLHPRVNFSIATFDTHVDMVDGGFDVCFADDRFPVASHLVRRPLTSFREVLVASPAYLALSEVPRVPTELNHHALLTVSDGTSSTWEFTDGKQVFRIKPGGTLTATSCTMVRIAALNHMGIALLPLSYVCEDISRNTLIHLLPEFRLNGAARSISILYTGRNFLSSKVRSFVDFVVERYHAMDRPGATLPGRGPVRIGNPTQTITKILTGD
jgi:DNA-binding transcriptional LysR family regulator